MKRSKYDNYSEYFQSLYYPGGISYDGEELNDNEAAIRNITFVVTDECQLRCTYCYEINKGLHVMSKETAKKAVDLLFDMYNKNDSSFINKKTKSLILDFIGGEPFLNVELMDFICDYFLRRAIKEHNMWAYTVRFSISSNGQSYFEDEVQRYLKKYRKYVSLGISLDGPKEIHDACRIYPNGRGSFDKAFAAFQAHKQLTGECPGTKITLSPNNLTDLQTIVNFFLNEGCKTINMNCIYEAEWTVENAKTLYYNLKQLAETLLKHPDVYISMFDDNYFHPMASTDILCWCGGGGKMLAFDYDGVAYPCNRFCPTSLGEEIPPLVIGSTEGLFLTEEQRQLQLSLQSITRRSKSTDECFNCPVAAGCSDCEAWNYQQSHGQLNKRATQICIMHKARSLANVYFWNLYYKFYGQTKRFRMWLPKDDAIDIIGAEEYKYLYNLQKDE